MSEERGKGISLRKKKSVRPKISAPRQIVPDETLTDSKWEGPALQRSETSTSSIRGRPSIAGTTDRTADLVKRRYSTRFVGGYPGQDAQPPPPIPAMPQMPAQYAAARPSKEGRSPDRKGGQQVAVDAGALRDPRLQPEQYVANVLADATENDILNYQSELRKLKNRTSTDLQHNVYQNRTQFIKISKEADKLKSEMRTMRSLMSELTGALGQAASAGGVETNGMSEIVQKRRNRSSVANLEALWSTQLQALWKRVEGSQKFLPAIPGRHIMLESSRWVELNAATWKPRRRVHIILLNDHLLIASEKKRSDNVPSPNRRQSVYMQGNASQLVAERCWPVQDVQMADIARTSHSVNPSRDERSNIANAVNVRVGTESWTFATVSSSDSSGEKSALLVAFRKATEDLRKTMAAEHGERERKLDELSFLNGDTRLKSASSLNDAAASMPNRSSTLIEVDGRQQTLRWVENQIDALDIDIALQRFEDAVARTEKLRRLARSIKNNTIAQEIILAKIDERAAKLAGVVGRRLKETNAGAIASKENVGWLVRLGFEEMARVGYLDARKETLKKRTRQLPFTGSLPPFLTALSYVTFTLILHTFRTFNQSFAPSLSSAVVKWAKERVDEFNESLERQLSSVERGSPLWNECLEIVRTHAGVLGEVAVDFTGLVARGLDEGVVAVDGSGDASTSGGQSQSVDKRRAPAGPRAVNGS